MRFIRKNGRIIPINDGMMTPKEHAAYGAKLTATGAAMMAGGGVVAHKALKAQDYHAKASYGYAKNAQRVQNAKDIPFAIKTATLGNQKFMAHKHMASALKAGKIGSRAAAVGGVGLLLGAVGVASMGIAGLRAGYSALKGKKKNESK